MLCTTRQVQRLTQRVICIQTLPGIPSFPRAPKVASGQEASHRMSSEVMDPALSSELSHDGVDEGEASACFAPRLESLVLDLYIVDSVEYMGVSSIVEVGMFSAIRMGG